MSDGSKVFYEVKKSLKKAFPKMSGHEASHFSTLLHMVSGMVVSKHCHLPKIAGKVKSTTKQESIIAKLKRWLSNQKINGDLFFLPFLERILPTLINGPVRVVIDGSVVGRNSACLMASIIYKNRAIPVAWLLGEGRKGHFKENYHIELLSILKSILPSDVSVTVIGDGEFDGTNFLESIEEFGWRFVVRTANNAKITQQGKVVHLPKRLMQGQVKYYRDVSFTNEYYGPVQLIAWRPKDQSKIIYLISNHPLPNEALLSYKKRQAIETFFSDLKTKGFYLQKSHLRDLGRLSNLVMAACIAYIWVVLLGEYALNKGVNKIFHRTKRCDLSLFQLGFRYIEYLLNNDKKIPEVNFLEAL